jgi:hypothetical protein
MWYRGRGAHRVVMLVLALTAGAGLFTLLITDIDAFEARTGLFSTIGIIIIDAIVALVALFTALYAASIFFPRSWGPKAGPLGAIICAIVCAFCISVLIQGGA